MNDQPKTFHTTPWAAKSLSGKVALITGVTGQDGAYLAELLLAKGYQVHGLQRRSSSPNTSRITHLLGDADQRQGRLQLHDGDMTDGAALMRVMATVRPDEVYNLAAQSHVGVSFDAPEYTAQADAIGPLRLLEAIRTLGMSSHTRYYQASTSELYGEVQATPQTESTPFAPRSPYAAAKLYAYWITVNYRAAYGMYACNGILFNHESPRRGEDFVTRKITLGLARIASGTQTSLHLGNLDALRDWGHARDYVEMQWLMLQQPKADDFVIATGSQYSVRHFVNCVAAELGIELSWQGHGYQETATIADLRTPSIAARHCRRGQIVIRVDPALFRPTEVHTLLGDASKAARLLGWHPSCSFTDLVKEMTYRDLALVQSNLSAEGVLREMSVPTLA